MFLRLTVLTLAAGGAGYVAGTLLQETGSLRDVATAFAPPAFARPMEPVDPNVRDPRPATGVVPAAPADLGRSDHERVLEPRECDLTKGISTDCLFMD
jgi:hypothetical protein